MKSRVQKLGIAFLGLVMLLPQVGFASTIKSNTSRTYSNQPKILRSIQVTPEQLRLPQGTSEEKFREQIKVVAYYKGENQPVQIQNYKTNYGSIKEQLGTHRVAIGYVDNGCKARTNLCVIIEEAPQPSQTPSPTPTPGQGIINFPYVGGYEDGTFRPDQAATREEVASMLARLISNANVPRTPNVYSDLNPQRYSTDNINYVTKLGLFKPNVDGTFKPFEPVSQREVRKIVANLTPYVKGESAEFNKLTDSDKPVTRAQMVVILNQLFSRVCQNKDIINPYRDLPENYWAYNAILCASVKNEQPAIQPRQ